MNKTDKIVYIAELDNDVDNIIAVEYLHGLGLLDYVVLDPVPVEKDGLQRLKMIEAKGIRVSKGLSGDCTNVFCGGQLTEIARHIKSGGTIKNLVLQGGFVGSNLVPFKKQINKFKGKEELRTFSFNCDVKATDYVLRTNKKQIESIYCIGKNVSHNPINSDSTLWKAEKYKDLFKKYNVKEGKLQYNMLACHEGICLIGIGKTVGITVPFCTHLQVRPFNTGLNGNKTLWGSSTTVEKGSKYRLVTSAITFTK